MPVSGAIAVSGALAVGSYAATFAGMGTLATVLSLASYGLSKYAELKLKDRAQKATDTVSGTQEALPVVYGTRKIGGRVVDARVDDTSDDRKRMDYVVALCVGPEHGNGINGVTRVWLDDTLAIDGGGGGGYIAEGDQTGTETAYGTTAGVQKDPYNPDDPADAFDEPFLAYNFFTGTDDQSMPQFLKDSYSDWDSDSDLKGIAVLHLSMWWHEDVWSGVPDVKAELEGNTVLDPRTDQITFDNNPIICGLDYALSRKYGMGMDAGNLMDADAGEEKSGTSATYHTYFGNKSLSLLGLSAGDNVSLAGDVKSETGSDTTRLVLEVYDSSNTLLDTQTATDTTGTYNRVSIENYSLPSNADNITVYAENTSTTETAYARRVTLVQSSRAIGFYDRFDESSITSEADFCKNTNNVNITTPKRFSVNAVVETDRDLRSNIQELMASCRGQVLYDMGTVRFHIPRAKSVESYVIDEDDIIGDYSWKRQGIKNTANSVVASYVDADHDYQARDKKWPEPGATNVSLTEEDSGFRSAKSIDLPHTTNREMAGRIAQILFNEIREDVTVSFRATPELLRFNVGDVVKHSHDAEGWTEKEFWVANMGLNPDGTITVGLNEYNSNAYNVSNISTDTPVPGTDLPDPTPNTFRIFNVSLKDDGTVYVNVWGGKHTESIELNFLNAFTSSENQTTDSAKLEHTTSEVLTEGESVTVEASLYAQTGTTGRPLTDSIQVERITTGGSQGEGGKPVAEIVYRPRESNTNDLAFDLHGYGGDKGGSISNGDLEARVQVATGGNIDSNAWHDGDPGTSNEWATGTNNPLIDRFLVPSEEPNYSSINKVDMLVLEVRDTSVVGNPKARTLLPLAEPSNIIGQAPGVTVTTDESTVSGSGKNEGHLIVEVI